MPSFAAAPLLWAGIVTSAIIAVTRPSRSTLVVTAIAQSARLMHERSGFSEGSKSCCRLSTTISYSAFLTHWCHSFGRTRESRLRFCSKPRPPLYWKWHLIRKHLGAEIGFFDILHTWRQNLQQHPHIHCVVPGDGLSPEHACWISSRSIFILTVKVLSRVFRGKFCAG